MSSDIILFFFSYILIIYSVIGYGLLACTLLKININQFNLGYFGLIGIFILIIFSYTSHYFLPHNYVHNSIIFLIGFSSFILFLRNINNINEFYKINILFIFFFVSFLIYKNHDDFSYYHFPYTYYLTQNNLLVGIGNFNHGFRTPSSIFYLNSLFYLPYIKFYFFQIGAVMIMGFSSFILLKKIDKKLKSKNYDKYFFLSLLSLLFVSIFFYRIAEHGTDRSAMILIFLLIIELYNFASKKNPQKLDTIKIIILLGLIISFKSFYILYLILIIPIIFNFFIKQKIKYFFLILNNFFFYFFILILFNILLINFLNSGCLIYPVEFTCVDTLSWSIPLQEVSIMNDWYEQWAKAGANPNFRVENPQIYIQGFNWFDRWFDEYFFNKVSDFLLGIFFMMLIVFLVFGKLKRIKFSISKIEIGFYFLLFLLFFEWIYNHPSLRYGGYVVICLLFFIPFSMFLSSTVQSKNFEIKTFSIIILALVIFLSRNVDRIVKENKKYQYNPFKKVTYNIDNSNFRISKKMENLLLKKIYCAEDSEICFKNEPILVKKENKYFIFYKKKSKQ